MEADRMGWLLPALTDARFRVQRDVVLNERRQNYENRPYGLAHFVTSRALYPATHPYAWPTIGDPADLLAATVGDARAFFTTFYHPGNASLAIAGDVSADDVCALVERLFGAIPRGPVMPAVMVPPMATRPRRVVLEDRVELPRLYLTWPTPGLFADGDAALDLAADHLANGKTARLYRRLVYDARIATDLSAAQGSRELCGMFQLVATAAPGHTLAELQAGILEAIDRFAATGPTAGELARSLVQAETSFVARLETLGGFGGRSDQLNAYNVFRGTPAYFDEDLARYQSLTIDDLREAARMWLRPDTMVALSVVPRGRIDLALADSDNVTSTHTPR
jgi:zinc protease